ncbi:alpha/beta hydrolase [Cytophagaceae bacterium DM2B3-1]|uniref:Alpha/beta hydrolase n=1 Tax=Xanthocytophaga flava TaxID=3048013 RepID=A0ABT7CSG5_9BACT|nr:alpha/beta hydrolase [Xanthocytophaga flavus]MDJ1496679.1 alpha/beta hydrolase [Xanthocytophaga flavus]
MRILKQEEEWEDLPDDKILSWFSYTATETNQRHMEIITRAYAQAPYPKSKFPVVIYAPSYQASSVENFTLCEYLASQGYVVISSPSQGTQNRFLEGATTRDIETQAKDIAFLLGHLYTLSFVDTDRIAVGGFSFGGISNVLAHIQDPRIKAIVCLDGSIRYQFGKLPPYAYAEIPKISVPFLFMAQKDIPLAVMQEDGIDTTLNTQFAFWDSLHYSQAYFLKFHDLTHAYFSSMGILFQERDSRQDKSDQAIVASYRWVNEYTLHFLNAFLKEDTFSRQFLSNGPVTNQIPSPLISIRRKEPLKRDFSFEQFHTMAKKQGYHNLEELFHELKRQHPKLVLHEWKLNNLGLQLLFKGKKLEGIQVLSLATLLYPQSSNAFDSLAEGYLLEGNKELAISNFKLSLNLNPQNQNALDQLTRLQKN